MRGKGRNGGKFRGDKPNVQCQFFSKQGHTAYVCNSLKNLLSNKPNKESSNMNYDGHSTFMASSNNNAINGVLDSGVSHHVTNESNVISNVTPYIGSDGVVIGNRGKIPITCTRNSIILVMIIHT